MVAEVIKDMVQGTLGIVRIMGELAETSNPALFMEAKGIAQKMALALEMPEASEVLSPVSRRGLAKTLRKYSASMSRLAKACEAWDHMEDFPYRETFEEHIKIILRL